jgi:hypothetical protein
MKIETEAKRAAQLMLEKMDRTDAAYEPFEKILEAAGALPLYPPDDPDGDFAAGEVIRDAVFVKRYAIVTGMFDRVCSHLLESSSLAEAIMHALPKTVTERVTS